MAKAFIAPPRQSRHVIEGFIALSSGRKFKFRIVFQAIVSRAFKPSCLLAFTFLVIELLEEVARDCSQREPNGQPLFDS